MQQVALLVVTMALSSSETKTDESKFYDREDKERFYNYFLKPPAKRGRPKKKKRRGGRPRKKTGKKEASQTMIDGNVDALTPKQKADLAQDWRRRSTNKNKHPKVHQLGLTR